MRQSSVTVYLIDDKPILKAEIEQQLVQCLLYFINHQRKI